MRRVTIESASDRPTVFSVPSTCVGTNRRRGSKDDQESPLLVMERHRLATIKRAHSSAYSEGFPHTIAGILPRHQRPEIPRHLSQACTS